jgi:DNA-binding IscR family transcriptional regulator
MNEQQEHLLIRVKLTLSINKLLANNRDAMYLSSVENTYYRSATRQLVNEVISQMEADGLLKKVTGKLGGYILLRCIEGVPIRPEVLIEDVVKKPRINRDEQRQLNSVNELLHK